MMIVGTAVAAGSAWIAPSAEATFYDFELPASNGYETRFSAASATDGADIEITSEAPELTTSTRYAADATVNTKKGKVAVSFGDLGSIRAKFVPRGKKKKFTTTAPGCKGVGKYQPGTFKGTIDLTAEMGFTEVAAAEAPGRAWADGAGIECRSTNAPAGVTLATFKNGAFDRLSVFKAAPDAATVVTANSGQTLRTGGAKVDVSRELELTADASAFTYAADLSSATVTLPAPFAGTGTYAKGNPSSFTGDLSVAFPGTAPVEMTDPDSVGMSRDN